MFDKLNFVITSLSFWTGVAGGGAVVWFFKNTIQKLVIGANALSAKLHAEADAISATINKKP